MIFEITLDEMKILIDLVDGAKYYNNANGSIIAFPEGYKTIGLNAHENLLQKKAIVFLEQVLYHEEVYDQYGITEEMKEFTLNFEEGLMY